MARSEISQISFFFYGTLIDPDVRRFVFGEEPETAVFFAATLPGYTVRYVLRARYPALLAKPGARAAGLVMTGLSQIHAKTLDRYEGDGYSRVKKLLRLKDRSQIVAMVYIPKSSLRAGPRPWSYETWAQNDKDFFIRASGLSNPLRGPGTDSRAR